MRPPRIAIAPSIFSITLLIALGLAAAIILYTQERSSENAEIAAGALMDRALETIDLRIAGHVDPIARAVDQARFWSGLAEAPTLAGHPARAPALALLTDLPQSAAVLIGFETGDYYQLSALGHRPTDYLDGLDAPAGAAFQEDVVLRAGRDQPLGLTRFLDARGATLTARLKRRDLLDPRGRPWFGDAWQRDVTIRTDAYRFESTGTLGLTLARGFEGGVVGVDLTLTGLSDFLNRVPQARAGVLAVFRDDATILARSSLGEGDPQVDEQTLARRRAQLSMLVRHFAHHPTLASAAPVIDGRAWLARRDVVELGGGARENVLIAMPRDVVVGPIEALARTTLFVSLAFMLASVPLIWLVSRRISRPVRALSLASERIGRFDLEDEIPARSMITEILQLERAMERMRHSLSIFSLYAPKALVRQLVASETRPALGGTRRDVTVLFMDLENFTAMSSHLEPEEVMRRMSAYFERVTSVLLAHGATIDKYIGDAVMAFWNAPNDTPDHAARACRAALEILEVAQAQTQGWSTPEGAPVRTRIGLSSGPAIIGNVGSSDRLNYTALGSTVNLAARLENLNRDLGTGILVSEEVVARVDGRFAVKPAGRVSVKGYDEPVAVFELTGFGR